jgi:hypothetical protein
MAGAQNRGGIPYGIDPSLGVQLVDQELQASSPASSFEFVDVTFNSVANTDTDITHGLNSDHVDYQVVGLSFLTAPATVPVIYRDISGSARPWGKNYLILRANVAGLVASLLLTVRRD